MPSGIRLDTEFLKTCRTNLRLSQAEVARALEIHPVYYQRVESGRAGVSVTLLGALEGYFDLDPDAMELVHPDDRHLFVVPPL